MKSAKPVEAVMRAVFLVAACVAVLCVVVICIFLFANGLPAIFKIGFDHFLFGVKWKPSSGVFGIAPMILGSVYATTLALVIGVPIGVLSAIFLVYYCPKKLNGIISTLVNLLASIPSIIYGFFGLVLLVPFVKFTFGGTGKSVLTAGILLGFMILPTIIAITVSSLKAVPPYYYEGSLALGTTKEHSIFKVVLPAAKSGIAASIILGIGRAIGETMAVVMVAGNQASIPSSITSGFRTMTANIVLEMGYAADLHRDALIATAVVLFMFILIINLIFAFLNRSSHE